MSDRGALRGLCTELALAAGRLAREGRAVRLDDIDSKSSATDLVTEYDRAAEALIVGRLRVLRPDDGIVGEEGTDHPGTSGLHWLIDPIDGTTNFVYGLPYAVSVAVRDDRGGLAGAVYLPLSDELFSAARGDGATLNGQPIRCSPLEDISRALVSTGFAYLPERRVAQAARIHRMADRLRDIRRLGAAALDLCYVACGRTDGYFEQWINPWDIAAGELIVQEAGGRVSWFRGGEGEVDGIVASASGVHDTLIGLIEGH